MKFTKDAVPGLLDGSITLTFRMWKSPQAKVGGRHRVWGLLLQIDDVRQVGAGDITDTDARRAGSESALALRERLGDPTADQPVWRVEFRCLGEDDRVERRAARTLSAEERTAIQMRLDRMDRASKNGPWTKRTLNLIATYPGVVSTALARRLGHERPAFKLNVRKLKELGLTESLDVGYRMSPLGEALINDDASVVD